MTLKLIRAGASRGARALQAAVQGEMEQGRELWEIQSSHHGGCEGDKYTLQGGRDRQGSDEGGF